MGYKITGLILLAVGLVTGLTGIPEVGVGISLLALVSYGIGIMEDGYERSEDRSEEVTR